jgi:prepilin-type N-terminal cleavage/methylation domain-containing protein
MTTITPSPVRNRIAATRGFTLVEMMIGATISSFVLSAVLTTFLFMGRSGANVQNYNDMEQQARTALEFFAEDTRQASGVVWNSTSSLSLTVVTNTVTYVYDSTTSKFTRTVVNSGGTTISTRTLITGITSGSFAFSAYKISDGVNPISLASATDRTSANGTTKQIQLSLECTRSNRTVVAATNSVLSARFILRNKKVTA